MVIDSSALIAILLGEPDADLFAQFIERDPIRLISTATVLEMTVVSLRTLGESGRQELDTLIHHTKPDIVPFTGPHLNIAQQAYEQFGKGRHPARLNYGDCFSYALSKASGEPLLFKGNDFTKTDIVPVVMDSSI